MDQLESEPDPNSFYHRQKILTSALALTALCAQLTTLMAALFQEAKKENVSWNEWETRELVQFFWEHGAESGDGGNFKPATYHAAAQHVAPHLTLGPAKAANNVKTKWTAVSCLLSTY